MVDELWMWILDKKTIITSFPHQYGSDKDNASDVHEAIRIRIKNAQRNQIRSVFDVALIVIDECLNNLFNIAKSHHLWHWSKRAFMFYITQPEYKGASDVQLSLISTSLEPKLQLEIRDIIDELDIMINITRKQQELIKRLLKHGESILDSNGMCGDDWTEKQEKEKLFWFRKQAIDLTSKVDDKIVELEGLRNNAERTGRKLPLSFMSSVFSMNNSSIGDTKMSFPDQASYMFPISAAVILVSITTAFWKFPRTVLWSVYKMTETWLLVNSGAYYCWLMIRERYTMLTSDNLLSRLEWEIKKMKAEVRRRRYRARIQYMDSFDATLETRDDDQENDNELAMPGVSNRRPDQRHEGEANEAGSLRSWIQLNARMKVPDGTV
ncbi:ankyrin repeat protein [Colletotrichum kahawae]|uniref:Ankyrin repeat protein n=1 Tax=Colletotrichum kahawae TaxID=34407 RepID=A0AAD9YW01_COLKA|nr:ankyrin repeat protein [Colletotrichum kahawae]